MGISRLENRLLGVVSKRVVFAEPAGFLILCTVLLTRISLLSLSISFHFKEHTSPSRNPVERQRYIKTV